MNQTSMELKGDREIVIARTFNGPPRIVFDAWTRPELVRRWWAPKSRRVSLVGCDADVRVGGGYRYVARLDAGGEFAFSGVYTEVTPYSRLVYTEIFEPTASGAKADDARSSSRSHSRSVTARRMSSRIRSVRRRTCATRSSRRAWSTACARSMDQLDELAATLAQVRRQGSEMKMAKSDRKAVDEYIASQPKAVQAMLTRVRSTIRKAVPGAEETISYGIPTYKLHGRAGDLLRRVEASTTRSIRRAIGSSPRSRTTLTPYDDQQGHDPLPALRARAGEADRGIAKFRAKEAEAKR